MGNFYSDNRDLVFTLKNLDLSESVGMLEENYTCSAKYPGAPVVQWLCSAPPLPFPSDYPQGGYTDNP